MNYSVSGDSSGFKINICTYENNVFAYSLAFLGTEVERRSDLFLTP